MSQRLFAVPKIPLFLDGYTPGVEKRRDEDVTVIRLTLRVQPFDAKLASAIDNGLGDDSGVRAALFKLSTPDPKPHVERVNMSLDCPRQQLAIHAAPDTKEPRLLLNQAKITGVYARTQKDVGGYAFVFQAAVGPVGPDDLAFVHTWFRTQRFVTFEAAEPMLGLDNDNDDPDDEGNLPTTSRPSPMFDDDDANSMPPEGRAAAAESKEESRPTAKRGAKRTAKIDHDKVRKDQAAGQKRATAVKAKKAKARTAAKK